jgi:penicillin-binding protein activator
MKSMINAGKWMTAVALAGSVLMSAGCETDRTVRLDPSEEVNLTRRFNDSDAAIISTGARKDLLSRPWLAQFRATPNRPQPIIVVGRIRNKSDQADIPTEMMTDYLKQELLNSGMVGVLSEWDVREEVRTERHDTEFADKDLLAEIKKRNEGEHVADYMLVGTITNDREISRNRKDDFVTYQVTFTMVDVVTQRQTWIYTHSVKKARA